MSITGTRLVTLTSILSQSIRDTNYEVKSTYSFYYLKRGEIYERTKYRFYQSEKSANWRI